MNSVDAILFDFDGTLAPNLDLPDMRRQVVVLTQALGVPEAVFKDCYIVEIIDAAKAWLVDQESKDVADQYYHDAHALIVNIEMAAAQGSAPFPRIHAYLGELKARGVRTGVVTRNCRSAIYTVFPEIDAHIDVVCARDDVVHFKPDPRHLVHCLECLDASAKKSVMVGDGRMDMQVGKSLGMHCIGVLSGNTSRQALLNAGADEIYNYCFEFNPG